MLRAWEPHVLRRCIHLHSTLSRNMNETGIHGAVLINFKALNCTSNIPVWFMWENVMLPLVENLALNKKIWLFYCIWMCFTHPWFSERLGQCTVSWYATSNACYTVNKVGAPVRNDFHAVVYFTSSKCASNIPFLFNLKQYLQ